jgi:small subunit ribosomal protein S8
MTDPIADMIIRIKNALMAGHVDVVLPSSKMKVAVANILKEEGYVAEVVVEPTTPQSTLNIKLKYIGSSPAITEVKRVSKPGLRRYTGTGDIPRALGGYGITIMTTSKGVMTGTSARKQNVGGEILCQIW